MTHGEQLIAGWKASCKPQPLYGRGPVLSILPSEIPPWAQTILIVLLGLALFAAMVRL
jgi:hypothetical protein